MRDRVARVYALRTLQLFIDGMTPPLQHSFCLASPSSLGAAFLSSRQHYLLLPRRRNRDLRRRVTKQREQCLTRA